MRPYMTLYIEGVEEQCSVDLRNTNLLPAGNWETPVTSRANLLPAARLHKYCKHFSYLTLSCQHECGQKDPGTLCDCDKFTKAEE